MKLTLTLLLFAVFAATAGSTYSQNVQINLKMNDATLVDVFREIERTSEFGFFFKSEELNLDQRVSIDLKNASIEDILKKVLSDRYEYRILDKNIIITRGKFTTTEQQQGKSVSGKVTDSSGSPLPGVSVVLKGTTNGTITDADGQFLLGGVNANAILQFSFVGMKTQEIMVGAKLKIDVTLFEESVGLEEVVAVGYGTQKRGNLTGAVSTVKSNDLVKSPAPNVTQTLAGRVPGLITKQNSGEPGFDNANLNIRGYGAPLVIVDGIESSLNNLDPNEIESISVLKDASAAVYGARAGNGVILVTTKRGDNSKPTLTFNSSYSMQGYTLYPELLDAGRYAELIREGQISAGVAPTSIRFTEEQVQKYKAGNELGYQSTNWFDVVMNKYSPLQNHNLTIRGGSSAIKFFTLIGYTGQSGMFKSGDNHLNRYNVRANFDAQITKNLTAGFDMSLIRSMLQRPQRASGSLWQDLQECQPVYAASLPDPTKIGYTGVVISTVASSTRDLGGYVDSNDNQIFSTLNIKYNIPGINGLSVKGLANYIGNFSKTKSWSKNYVMWTYDPVSQIYTQKPSAVTNSQLSETYSESNILTGQIFVNYDRIFAEKHNVSALFITEMSSTKALWITAGNNSFITNALDYLFAGSSSGQQSNGSASETGRLSYIGRVNYNYDNKYFLESTVRYDGSPKFPSNMRWGFFPSISAGWRISEESFLKDQRGWLDNLKIRGGFSKTGYDAIGAFQYLTGFNFANRYVVDGVTRTGLKATGLANPDITWENMTIYNIGFDFTLFNNKFYGEFDAFYRDRQNILATRILSLPTTFGATLPQENINSMNNRGFELMAGYKDKRGEFSYDVSANISFSRARWDHYEEPDYTDPDDVRINKVSGNWADRWFGYKSDGLFTSQDEIKNYKLDQDNQKNASLKPGDVKYIDQNDDSKLDWRDKIQIGNGSNPLIMFGINVNLAYKNFDLSLLGQGATKFQYMLNFQTPNEGNMPEILYEKRWSDTNNNKWAEIPRVYIGTKTNNYYSSDYWLKDASYFRIKTLNVGYTLPNSILNKIAFNSLRIYFSGTNLFTISGMKKFSVDPEAPNGVRSGLSYPQQKVYSIGLNVSF